MGAKMWLLCLLLTVEMVLSHPDKIPSFGLFVPRDVYYPSTDTFCLHSSSDLQGYSHMSVDLKTSSGSVNLYTVHPDSPTWHCQSFQVPEPSEDTEKVTIAVHGHDVGGNKTEFSSKELTLRKKSTGTLIQTDKAIYKPGQKIMIRILTLDQDLDVLNKTYSLVQLQDPQKNRLAQWKDVYAKSRIVELSYEMSPEAATGKYRISTDGASMEFIVDEYILPKFEVNVECPSSITLLDEEVNLWISGVYTYGENVQGNVSLTVCQKKRRMYWWRTMEKNDDGKDDICYSYSAKTESCGKLKSVVNLSQFRLRDSEYERQLKVEASVEEEGTDVKFSAPSKIITIQSQLTKLSFKDTRKYYQPGVPYRGKLVLESFDGKRLSGKTVQLSIKVNGGNEKENYTTNSDGEISFQLTTSKWGKGSVSLEANIDEKNEPYSPNIVPIRYGSAYLYLQDIYVATNSSVYIHPVKSSAQCHENVTVTVDYTLEEQEKEDIDFFYLVLVNNRVSLGGQKKVKKADSLSSSFQFPLPIVDISPSGKLLVFMMSQSGGIAADITEVEVTACLKHMVSLRFSEEEVLPGSPVQLHLQANGGSMCALRAVDKSVVLMKPEAELTEKKIQNLVPRKRTYMYSNRYDYEYCYNKKTDVVIKSSEYDDEDSLDWWDDYPEKKKDFLDIFQEMGFYVASSWNIVAPTICIRRRIMPMMKSAAGVSKPGAMSSAIGAQI